MIAPIELRLDDHGIPLADERGGRSLVAEFAQDSGFDPCQPEGVTDGFAEVVQRPDYIPHPGGVPAARIRRYETCRIKLRFFVPTARPAN